MKISTKGKYALIIMIDLAKEYKNDNFVSLKEISKKEHISLKYLEKLMNVLNKNDYFITSRGKLGGYKLKYEPKNYKVGDILRMLEGSIDIAGCGKNICPKKNKCKTYKIWDDLNNLINNYLDSKTLEDYI